MGKDFSLCPVHDESPDPCPLCGATVNGDDVVKGICQAPEIKASASAAMLKENDRLKAENERLQKEVLYWRRADHARQWLDRTPPSHPDSYDVWREKVGDVHEDMISNLLAARDMYRAALGKDQ